MDRKKKTRWTKRKSMIDLKQIENCTFSANHFIDEDFFFFCCCWIFEQEVKWMKRRWNRKRKTQIKSNCQCILLRESDYNMFSRFVHNLSFSMFERFSSVAHQWGLIRFGFMYILNLYTDCRMPANKEWMNE